MGHLLDKAYMRSPVWAQQAMVGAYGAWWYWRRYGAGSRGMVQEFLGREHWSAGQFRAYQEARLRAILLAAQSSRYYGELLRTRQVDLNAPPFNVLESLPLLTKEVLRTRPRDFLTEPRLPRGVLVFRSSGTTGTPTEIYFTLQFHRTQLAVGAARSLAWAGVHPRSRRVMFGSRKVCDFAQDRPPFWRHSPAENLAYASIYHLAPGFLPHYIDFLRRFRPEVISGYPNALATIARFALASRTPPAPAKVVITTSETVTIEARRAIEEAWQCPVMDRYGAVEGCVFVSQCEHGRYHVSPEIGIVEILDDNGAHCRPGELGRVVCTGLQNTLQPLIRYSIGDMARWSSEQICPCGREMPMVDAIEGRFEDMCVTPDGRAILRFDTVFKGIGTIAEAQVVQESIDGFLVRIVPGGQYTAANTRAVVDNMRLHVGNDVSVRVELVERIDRTPSGKFQAVVSRLSRDEARQACDRALTCRSRADNRT